MIRFAENPDKVFTEIITNVLGIVIGEIEQDIEQNEEDGFTSLYFEEKFITTFGGAPSGLPIILNELKKIEKAHLSSELYMPTDVHFKMLDRILKVYCDCYNDEYHLHEDTAIKCKGKILHSLSYNEIVSYFFWDDDYDLDEETALHLLNKKELRKKIAMDLSIQALNTAAGKPIDFSDLIIKKCEDAPKRKPAKKVDLSSFWFCMEE